MTCMNTCLRIKKKKINKITSLNFLLIFINFAKGWIPGLYIFISATENYFGATGDGIVAKIIDDYNNK